jgi:four helix bundle protein
MGARRRRGARDHEIVELDIGGRKSEVKFECETMRSEPNDKRVNSAKELDVYKLGYELAMQIFDLTKHFPPDERFALITQIRRSSRSVCLNLREAWAKRRYEAHFVSKLTDCDGENSETDSSLDFARDCKYMSVEEHRVLTSRCAEIGRMLGRMLKKSQSFLITELSDI